MKRKKLLTKLDEDLPFELPNLPSVIRYYNKFNDTSLAILNPESEISWRFSVAGAPHLLRFTDFPKTLIPLIRLWCAFQIQSYSPFTVKSRLYNLTKIPAGDIRAVITSTPAEIRKTWQILIGKGYSTKEMGSLKSILHFLCKFKLAAWSIEYMGFLATLPLPAVHKYASIRTGEVFLSIDEEAILVSYFDDMSQKVRHQPGSISDNHLRDVSILVCSYQFGLRPIQIGSLQIRDVRIWNTVDDAIPSVHLTFKMAKQRSRSKVLPMTRKIKHDWAPLLVELYERAIKKGLSADDHIFQLPSSQATGQVITKLTSKLLPASRGATELRHTAAQRLADAGASQEEVAEFMGHSDIDTCLGYFQTSPNQAELINSALGISEIYQKIVKIAHDRFISLEELAALKGEQQIGGAPHGIPITGIGGCSTGQPSCPSNPVIACYGCRKFLPLYDALIHHKVLEDIRGVISFFSDTSRGDQQSPTYLQLRRTISSIQGIITEIEEDRP